ncbi:MAG: choice-of-anchor tandem repeat GloVer-containing protein [Nostoc sp.]|uniref:choice-of-anchor tandem repeat GloVer-containing protein n=1 Tax=Nostoc sp. TaxID=1180 RepID=UPI002FF6EBF7
MNLCKQRQNKNRVLILTSLAVLASPLVLPLQQAFAGTLTTVVNFNGTNGAAPSAGVLPGSDGNLYGTTSAGGSQSKGTAFKLSGTTFSTLTTLVNFTGTNGTNPVARLFQASDGNLYGATSTGGTNNFGTLFKLQKTTFTTLTNLSNFNGTNGAKPAGRLISGKDGNLWGITSAGGVNSKGTIFKIPLTGGVPTIVVNFNGTNGATPLARLQLATDGNYYGTASAGGATNKGVAFKLTPAGLITSYSFSGANGQSPQAGLIESAKFIYGTTSLGGASNKGAIFKIPLGGGTPVLVASFNGSNGANPTAALTKGSDGNFYGTTSTGGANNKGAIYRLSGGTITLLFSFNGTNGATPQSTLIQLANGAFYGTASTGGASGQGTVFKFTP